MCEETYKPAGYCPRCGYALDPGKCPECGAVVTAERLVFEPPRITLRRRVRLAIILTLIVVVPYGGYRVYRDANWPAWVPSSLLLRFEHSDWERVDREILRRCATGEFSTTEVNGLFLGAFEASTVYAPRVPANESMPVIVRMVPRGILKPRLQGVIFTPCRDDWTLWCDGHERRVVQSPGFHLNGACPEVRFELPPLPPGQHDVNINGGFWYPQPIVPGMPTNLVWPVRVQFSVAAEDRPLSSFAFGRWNEDLAKSLAETMRAGAYGEENGQNPDLSVHFNSPPISMAVEVFVRPSGDANYQLVTDSSGPFRLVCSRGADWNCMFPLPKFAPSVSCIDVQLRPCLQEALFRGLDECLGGTLEWQGLPLTRAFHVTPHSGEVPPTRVFKQADQKRMPTSASAPASSSSPSSFE